jgi:hypothetical protein
METGNEGNLPMWNGASKCYSRAYRILETMARRGHVKPGRVPKRKSCYPYTATVSDDMQRLIDALNTGNEEEIKGLLLLPYYTDYEK